MSARRTTRAAAAPGTTAEDGTARIMRMAEANGAKILGVRLPETAAPKRPGKRPSKYRNVVTKHNGVTYHSKAEAKRAAQLDDMLRRGEIAGWVRQVKFFLPDPDTTYTVDFVRFEWSGIAIAEDVKGTETAKFRADVKRWRRYGPCSLEIIKGGRVVEIVDGKQPPRMEGEGDEN